MVGIMSTFVRAAYVKGTIRNTGYLGALTTPVPPVRIYVPAAESIDFRMFMRLPIPFESDVKSVLRSVI